MNNLSHHDLVGLFEMMLYIRLTEEKIAQEYPKGQMRTPTHLGTGQEAVAAGVLRNKVSGDAIFSHHRCHNHFLASGGSAKSLFAELLGRSGGCSGGRGGSVHLVDRNSDFYGSSPILGQSVALAAGAAYAFKTKGNRNIAIAFFGDAVFEEGTTWESFNFASISRLPALFVCENNSYSTESKLDKRISLETSFSERVKSFGIRYLRVNGNDSIETFEKSKEIVEWIREGNGPALIECETYRWREHVGPKFDWEMNRSYRTRQEIEYWMQKCPIQLIENYLVNAGHISRQEVEDRKLEVKKQLDTDFLEALDSPFPTAESHLKNIYASRQG